MPPAAVARREEPAARNALSNAPRWSPYRAIRRSGPAEAAAPIAPARPSHAGKSERRGPLSAVRAQTQRRDAEARRGVSSACENRTVPAALPREQGGVRRAAHPTRQSRPGGSGLQPENQKNGGGDAISTRTKVALIRDFERRIPRELPRFCRLRCHARRKNTGVSWSG